MKEPRMKRGRPAKPDGEFRRHLLSIRLNDEEDAFIRSQAAEAGLSVSVYARSVLINKKVGTRQTPLEAQMLFELNRCGVNLHQIVRSLNFGQGIPADLDEVLAELKDAVTKVGAAYDT